MDRSSICRRENSSYVHYGEDRERSGVGVKKPPRKGLVLYARLDTKKGGKDLYQLDIDKCRRGVWDPIYKGDVQSCLQRDHFDEPCHEKELFKDRLRREVTISMEQYGLHASVDGEVPKRSEAVALLCNLMKKLPRTSQEMLLHVGSTQPATT